MGCLPPGHRATFRQSSEQCKLLGARTYYLNCQGQGDFSHVAATMTIIQQQQQQQPQCLFPTSTIYSFTLHEKKKNRAKYNNN